MTGIWVDTDFGFDDFWALLLLRHVGCKVAGVSLVAGNAPLFQVTSNAVAAKAAYGFNWPLWRGAIRPLVRKQETAQRILGPTGMRSRGRQLDPTGSRIPSWGAVDAMARWLNTSPEKPHEMLALGPLTNIAHLLEAVPDLPTRVSRLVWMGGSAGAGNHTPAAEFNAVADAEAVEAVVSSGIPLDIVDLTFCRAVTFGPDDLPDTDPLTQDLLGGYLDIALERGRPGMAIYDPLAAIAIAMPEQISFEACRVAVSTQPDETYGATKFSGSSASNVRVATAANCDLSTICLDAFKEVPAHV